MRKFPWPRGKWRFILPGILILLVAGVLLAPRLLAGRLIARLQTRLETRHGMHLQVGSYRIRGISELELQRVSLCPVNSTDTLLKFREMRVDLEIMPALLGRVQLDGLVLDSCTVRAWRLPGRNNVSTLWRSRAEAPGPSGNYAQLASTLLHMVFDVLPDDARIRALDVQYLSEQDTLRCYVPEIQLEDEALKGSFALNERLYTMEGTLNLGGREADFTLRSEDTTLAALPVLYRKTGVLLGFRKLRFQLQEAEFERDTVTLKGGVTAYQLAV
ncbi:MAG: hypothetical protein KF690_12445, partial [Bacteroidetes bacterium]|nr:hypothetical protein [Bacteroidota bacterium]